MGTGGTITGLGHYLKEQNPAIQIIGVDPEGSLLLETWQRGRVTEDLKSTTYKVEGIGEDFLPSTLDLAVIDGVLRVGDKESFLMARRLVKEEGIFCGGSSGTAVAAALRYAENLTAGDLVVVILPDTGSRYLSKLYNDDWMRENGFLETEWSKVTLAEILERKPSKEFYTVRTDDRINEVIRLMKEKDISQVPVLNDAGQLVGLVTEVDLLKHMLEDGAHTPGETIASIVDKAEAVHPSQTPLEKVLPEILEGYVMLVTEYDQPAGILTKIDVLDFIAQEL
jgi:cystathionine beta-synthase